ncbi:BTAD domain-containing putative transcriptional regulator [Micromonospora sp. NPDC094482]|uniref:BTAD domain-containing putative transcriptional regulator n=1 Tax=unclassified Micromonospora TaxID=2617518 RepID=UPI003316CB37
MSTGFVIALAGAGAVTLWLLLIMTVLVRAYTALARRLRFAPTFRLPGPVQGLTAALLGATAVTTVTGATAHANPATTTGGSDQPHDTETAAVPAPLRDQAQRDTRSADQTPTYTVEHGDSLSEIAEQRLGDADRWPEIFALNRGTRFVDVGGTLRNPNVIHPGWTLDLPADAATPSRQRPRPPTATAPPSSSGSHADPSARNPDATTSPPATSPGPQHASTPATDSSPTAVATPTTTTGRASPAATDTRRLNEQACRGVSLPSGSWVDLGLALAVAAAVALVWAHRQRRYIPRAPSTRPRLDEATLAPMPRVVDQIRRGLRTTAGVPDPQQPAPLQHDTNQNDLDDEYQFASGDRELDGQQPDDDNPPNLAGSGAAGDPLPVPTLDDPLSVLWPAAGMGLTGPGAHAAARGFLTAALATGNVEQPQPRTGVLISSTTAATLLDAAAATLPRTPRLTITTSLDEALNILEAQTMRRTRLLYRHEADSVAELRRTDPHGEPLPPLMLIAETASRHERARVAALLAQGQRLDIRGVLLGDWPVGRTVTVAVDGATTRAGGEETSDSSYPANIGRVTVLDPAETADLLVTLAEAHAGQPQVAGSSERAPQAPAEAFVSPAAAGTADSPPSSGVPTDRDTTAENDSQTDDPRGATATTADDVGSTATGAPPAPVAEPRHGSGESATASGEADATARPMGNAHDREPAPRPLRVRVLGTPGVVDGDPQRTPRAKSLELLVYLAAHSGAASTEAILDDLLPDAPSSKAPGRLYTYVSGLRAYLRHNGGPGTYVSHPDHRYLLHPDTLDIDLWRMRTAIREAEQATDPHTRAAALRRAVDAYTGPLADGCDYEWIEPYREAVRRDALDAQLALADALADEPAQQIAVLDAAIAHHPHHEALYQAAMRARAELGQPDAIRALRRTLARRLNEIDAEPADDTLTLADRLITELQQRRGRHPSGDGSAA